MPIIIKTGLHKIPERCTKCKYSYNYRECRDDPMEKFCAVAKKGLADRHIPLVFNKDKKNYEYARPEWCPLIDTKDTIGDPYRYDKQMISLLKDLNRKLDEKQ